MARGRATAAGCRAHLTIAKLSVAGAERAPAACRSQPCRCQADPRSAHVAGRQPSRSAERCPL